MNYKHKLDELRYENELRDITQKNTIKLKEPPQHTISISDELTYERNINRVLILLIELDKRQELKHLENYLNKPAVLLTPQERVLKQKIKEFRKTQGNKDKILLLDKRWRLKPKWIIAASIGIVSAIHKNRNIKKDRKLNDLINTTDDRRIFLENKHDMSKVLKFIAFAIYKNKKLNSIFKKMGSPDHLRPNNPKFNKMISTVIDTILKTPNTELNINKNLVHYSVSKLKNKRLKNVLLKNPRFIINYILDNQIKFKRVLHHEINRKENNFEAPDISFSLCLELEQELLRENNLQNKHLNNKIRHKIR